MMERVCCKAAARVFCAYRVKRSTRADVRIFSLPVRPMMMNTYNTVNTLTVVVV